MVNSREDLLKKEGFPAFFLCVKIELFEGEFSQWKVIA